MAQKVQIHLEDDLHGGPADHTLTFALDGKDYEIDLSEANAEKLREALRPYVVAACRAPTGTHRRRKRGASPLSSPGETAAIRAWVKAHGHQISDRGLTHQAVRDAYYAATGCSNNQD
jgi:hypothetical protein